MHDRPGAFKTVLRAVGSLLPGDRLKTAVYLNAIAAPRRFLRKSIGGFYRMDHVYEVCKEFDRFYEGKFSILEFGVADGYAFTKKLYATRYLNMEDRVMVHGFDTFEGLPENDHPADDALVEGEEWTVGHYRGSYEDLHAYCARRYDNFRLHKGLFEDTLTEQTLAGLEAHLPILIWIDCDYYASTMQVFERLAPRIPTGCVVYFDDIDRNFASRFTGEMRAVWEINRGALGEGVELVLDRELSLDTHRVYRFVNLRARTRHRRRPRAPVDPVRRRRDDSPFP